MQKRRTRLFILFLPLLVSLACLSVIEPHATYPTDTPVVSPSPLPSEDPAKCAVISADEALHLRIGAGVASQVLAFMKRGEVVQLISSANSDWWLIKRGDLVGYARSKYLVKSEC